MQYLLDTNLLVHYIRNSKIWQYVEDNYFPKGLTQCAFISEVSKGEILGFALVNGWEKAKTKQLAILLDTLEILHITDDEIKEKYAEIYAYSQSRHPNLRPAQQFSARNMGKNDLWIAATASVEDLPLLSTDRDFEHLDGVFLNFHYINAAEILGI